MFSEISDGEGEDDWASVSRASGASQEGILTSSTFKLNGAGFAALGLVSPAGLAARRGFTAIATSVEISVGDTSGAETGISAAGFGVVANSRIGSPGVATTGRAVPFRELLRGIVASSAVL